MFAYALIAAELLLFSLVFYLIFIKEPKQFEVKENLWGFYGSDEKNEPTYLKPFMTTVENKLAFPQQAESSLQKGKNKHKINSQFKRMVKRTRHGVRGLSRGAQQELKNGWILIEEEQSRSSLRLSNLLAYLGRLLTSLSARVS